MNTTKYSTLGKYTSILSFLCGTVIFGLYFQTSAFELLFVGLGFIAIAGLINVGVLIAILLKAGKENGNKKLLYKTCGLMLCNIPVALTYCWFVITLINTMRITFINSTQMELTNIHITGCDAEHINKLLPDESKTVWVGIPHDCEIMIQYSIGGQMKEETVVGYATNSGGQKMKYNIGGKNETLF